MLYCSTSWQNDPHKRSKKLSLHWQSQKIVRWRCFQVKAHKSWLNSTKFFKVGGHYFKPSKLILNLTEKLEIILKRRVGTVTVESSFLFIIRWLYGRRRRIFRCLAVRRDRSGTSMSLTRSILLNIPTSIVLRPTDFALKRGVSVLTLLLIG